MKNMKEYKARAYRRDSLYKFDYPLDMALILNYLNTHGEILVSEDIIEELYRDFSDEKYCAGWMGVNEQMLKEFERWLADEDDEDWLDDEDY